MSERTLVAVHGNFASARWWTDLINDPPAGWRVVAPDLPGFAGTENIAEVSIPAYAQWLSGWLKEHSILRPVMLGHSLGGAVVMELARQHPEQVSGLILVGSCPLGGLVTPEENYPVLEMMRGNPALLDMSLGALFPSGKPVNFAELLDDAGRMADTHYSGNARALSGWSVTPEDLRDMPTLVLGGELDKLVTPDMVRAQARALGTQVVIFDGLGHGFPQEDPLRFRMQLESFLSSELLV